MTKRTRLGAALLALTAGLSMVGTVPAQAAPPQRDIQLILDYSVAKTCTVYPNFPKDGVLGNADGWTITPGDTVAWRYNANSTYAMVSDKKYRRTSHFWWGFIDRSCIGTSLGGEHFPNPDSTYPAGRPAPSRILEGRSAQTSSGYRSVDFPPAAGTITERVRATSFGTLRDHPGDFVVGNVQAGWSVDLTADGDSSWVKVYVPNAKRWGYLERIHI